MSSAAFQRIYDELPPLDSLPESGTEGDLAKLKVNVAYVWTQGQWVELDAAMKLVMPIQEEPSK